MLVRYWDRQDGGTYGARRLKDPSNAPGCGVEGLHQTTGASDENVAIDYRRLREGDDVTTEPICPLQLEARHVAEAQAGSIVGLISCVGGSGAPSVPARLSIPSQLHRAVRAVRCRRRLPDVAGDAQITSYRFTFVLTQLGCDVVHHPEIHGAEDASNRQLLQLITRRNARIARIVA